LEHEKAHYLLGRLYFLKKELGKGKKELAFLTKKGSAFAEALKEFSPKTRKVKK